AISSRPPLRVIWWMTASCATPSRPWAGSKPSVSRTVSSVWRSSAFDSPVQKPCVARAARYVRPGCAVRTLVAGRRAIWRRRSGRPVLAQGDAGQPGRTAWPPRAVRTRLGQPQAHSGGPRPGAADRRTAGAAGGQLAQPGVGDHAGVPVSADDLAAVLDAHRSDADGRR